MHQVGLNTCVNLCTFLFFARVFVNLFTDVFLMFASLFMCLYARMCVANFTNLYACCMLRQMREGKRKLLLIYPLRTKCWCGHQRLTNELSATDNDNENHSRGKKRVQALCSSIALPFACIFLQMDRKLARKSVLVACPEIWRAIWIAYVWIISSRISCLSAFAFMIHLYSGFSSGFINRTCWGNYASSLMPQTWTSSGILFGNDTVRAAFSFKGFTNSYLIINMSFTIKKLQ